MVGRGGEDKGGVGRGGRGRKGREMEEGREGRGRGYRRAGAAFPQTQIYDYTPDDEEY